jgi:hypothetical protein
MPTYGSNDSICTYDTLQEMKEEYGDGESSTRTDSSAMEFVISKEETNQNKNKTTPLRKNTSKSSHLNEAARERIKVLMQDFPESEGEDTVSVLTLPQATPNFDKLLRMFENPVTSPIAKGRVRTPGPDYPDLELPPNLHSTFKEETKHALKYFKEGKTGKVVEIIRRYVVYLKATKLVLLQDKVLGSHQVPDKVENLNLRLLFRLWHSFHYAPLETTKRRRGRGMIYTTKEVLAIDVGMYMYPPVIKSFAGQDEDYEFQWAEIKQDNDLEAKLTSRTKESICDKAKAMCKERMWESLKYFYKEQIRLRKQIIVIESKHKNS